MKELVVENMHCSKCVERITKVLKKAKIKGYEIDLNSKSILVKEEDVVTVLRILKECDYEVASE